MRDSYSSDLTGNLTPSSLNQPTQYSPLGYYNYQMATPFRATGSLAFIIGKIGLISAEYEFVNYNQARFYSSSSSTEFNGVNDNIKSDFTTPLNLKFGTEWRVQNFRIRGGYQYNGTPYKYSGDYGVRYAVSGGIGYRTNLFFADLSYIWSQMKDDYYLYDSSLVNASHDTYTSNNVVMTVGVRF